jgi:heme A synthase
MSLQRFAIATALATFCLLIAGGLVSTTESGLACPDWPLCEGQYFPRMIDGKQFEHTHRLVAGAVAVMTFTLCVALWIKRRRDRTLVALGTVAAGLVVVQALLGALTVKLALPAWVSSTHQATAMAFFCLIVTLAILARQRAPAAPRAPEAADPARPALGRWIAWVWGLTYVQMVIGAVMRHTRGGLACGYDFPLCLGSWWPSEAHLAIQAHLIHRWLGMLVGLAVLLLAFAVWRGAPRSRSLRVLAATAAAGVLCQLGLGIAVIYSSRDLAVMTLHSSLGAALLANLVALYWVANPSRWEDSEELLRSGNASAPTWNAA